MSLFWDYSTGVVLLGTVCLGIAAGLVGTYMVLRGQALLGDVASHATLPGLCGAYLVMESWQPGSGRWWPGLLMGAALSAACGLGMVQGLQRQRRCSADTAQGLVLSVFFGAGVCLLTLIQTLPHGQAAGLQEWILGKAAAMQVEDVWLLGGLAMSIIALSLLLHKEFKLICFDADYAQTQGWPVQVLDRLLTAMVVVVAVLGMQSVGALLVVALMILPGTAARFWTDRLNVLLVLAAGFGALAAAGGVILSALVPRLATGGVIVLLCAVIFIISLGWGSPRGLWWRWEARRRRSLEQGVSDLLRTGYELWESLTEKADLLTTWLSLQHIRKTRGWSTSYLRRVVREGRQQGLLEERGSSEVQFTAEGARAAQSAVERHRWWEWYLLHRGNFSLTEADRMADAIEHGDWQDLREQLKQAAAESVQDMPPFPQSRSSPSAPKES
ncbi:MAG: manganese ABC transporter permease [Planctomycetaceae bacterium]|nr:MAG: manganese ABC transporter permease [Planctomycetaceae bacterium]